MGGEFQRDPTTRSPRVTQGDGKTGVPAKAEDAPALEAHERPRRRGADYRNATCSRDPVGVATLRLLANSKALLGTPLLRLRLR
jgi:hypothetical protein